MGRYINVNASKPQHDKAFPEYTDTHTMMLKILLIIIAIAFWVVPGELNKNNVNHHIGAFLHAKSNLYSNNQTAMPHHPLSAYLRYIQIGSDFTNPINQKRILALLNENHSLAYNLRQRYLHHLAKQKNWQKFLQFYRPTRSTTLRCYQLYAQQKTQQTLNLALLKKLWLTGRPQNKTCDPVFQFALEKKLIPQDWVWERFRLAIEKRQFKLAKHLLKNLDEKKLASTWLALQKNRKAILNQTFEDNEKSHTVITQVLTEWARRRPQDAVNALKKINEKINLPAAQKSKIYRMATLKQAIRGRQNADQFLKHVAVEDKDEVLVTWLIRLALRQQNWKKVIEYTDELPLQLKRKAIWRYWRAHAFLQLENEKKARILLQELAKERHFYGIQASFYLGQAPLLEPEMPDVSADQIASVYNVMGIRRAAMLYRLNEKTAARREWFYTMQALNEKERYYAAKLAGLWGWHEIAIRTMRHNPYKDDLSLRFPMVHYDKVSKLADKHNVSPALIWAVMRQESSFMDDAKSPAGAMGLMQLMPQTARRYQKPLGIPLPTNAHILNVNNNIRIGIAHLADLRGAFKQPALQIAAYNAGGGAVRRWKRSRHPQKDINLWIELIPWFETRRYVKQVLTYQVIYEYLLDKDRVK